MQKKTNEHLLSALKFELNTNLKILFFKVFQNSANRFKFKKKFIMRIYSTKSFKFNAMDTKYSSKKSIQPKNYGKMFEIFVKKKKNNYILVYLHLFNNHN